MERNRRPTIQQQYLLRKASRTSQLLWESLKRVNIFGADLVSDVKGTRLVTPLDLLQEHRLDRRWLQAQLAIEFEGPTVVVTHHAPHPLSIATRYADDWVTTGFVNALPDAFFEVPKLWIHGHTHSRFDYQVGNCRVVCNPRGYKMRDGSFEVPDFDPGFVIEVSQ
ncbi:Icc-related predicted phosphoesterase [Rhodoferax ferrireducens]|uniref:Icc-related predicted phosphoesterase n=1 Tax=Rhodoferax ferrireducens TaxID=192843 RepID=A0ABU2CD94_9BURK|nr:hypothetical protein [Rhodoferax ferrireducens]MDR7379256.1 Icc-related predicted phosphoesterase [Rhodoferax ferrireducens]